MIREVIYSTPVFEGHVLTIEDYLACLDDCSITEDDGTGYYGTERLKTNIFSHFDVDETKSIADLHKFTHVHWYNK